MVLGFLLNVCIHRGPNLPPGPVVAYRELVWFAWCLQHLKKSSTGMALAAIPGFEEPFVSLARLVWTRSRSIAHLATAVLSGVQGDSWLGQQSLRLPQTAHSMRAVPYLDDYLLGRLD